jgi:hypothetical protein
MQEHQTTCLITHAAKRVARILRRIVKKTEDTIGRCQFGFRSGKATKDTIWMLRVTSE